MENQVNPELLKIASLYHLVFTSDQGGEVLRHMVSCLGNSHLSSNVMMDMDVSLNPTDFMFIREGQDSVVRHITRMMKYWEENK